MPHNGNRLPKIAKLGNKCHDWVNRENAIGDDMDPRTNAGGSAVQGRPTIKDVAALTGVAASTVSRALSQPGRVHAATKERVEAAAKQLGYIPTNRQLTRRDERPKAVALLLPDIGNGFFIEIARGVQHELRTAGYALLLVDTQEDLGLEASYLEELRSSVAGFILTATRLGDEVLSKAAAVSPLVTINRTTPGVPTVIIDTPSGVQQAVEHLYSLGHRDIAYIAGPLNSWSNQRRWSALQESAKTLAVSVRMLGPYHPSKSSGAAAADAMLNSGATACITFNDYIAIGMLVRLKERGVDVPGDVSIVGCDDTFGADFCSPPLTTLTSHAEQAGRAATDMLLSSVNPRYARIRTRIDLATHLTIRASTGPAPTPV